MNLKPSKSGVLALTVVAAIVFVACVLSVVLGLGKLNSMQAELDKKETEVSEAKQVVHKLEKTKLEYNDAKSQLKFLESWVSTQAYVPTLLRQLENLGKSVNLRITEVKPVEESKRKKARKLNSSKQASEGNVEAASKTGEEEAKPKKKLYDELEINVEVSCKYMNALDFLYRLTNFPKIIAVNKITVESAKTGKSKVMSFDKSPMLHMKMNLTAYLYKDSGPSATKKKVAEKNMSDKGRTSNEAG